MCRNLSCSNRNKYMMDDSDEETDVLYNSENEELLDRILGETDGGVDNCKIKIPEENLDPSSSPSSFVDRDADRVSGSHISDNEWYFPDKNEDINV